MNVLCIYLGEERGALMNVYVTMGTHSQPFLQNCLMDVHESRDEVLLALHMH